MRTNIPVHRLDDLRLQYIVAHKDETVETDVRREVFEEPVAVEPVVRVVGDPKLNSYKEEATHQCATGADFNI